MHTPATSRIHICENTNRQKTKVALEPFAIIKTMNYSLLGSAPIDPRDEEIMRLKLKNTHLENQLQELTSSNVSLEKRLSTVASENERLRIENLRLTSEISTKNEELHQARGLYAVQNEELDSYSNELNEARKQITILEKQIEDFTDSGNPGMTMAELQHTIVAMKSTFDCEMESKDAELLKTREELNQSIVEFEMVNSANGALGDKLISYQVRYKVATHPAFYKNFKFEDTVSNLSGKPCKTFLFRLSGSTPDGFVIGYVDSDDNVAQSVFQVKSGEIWSGDVRCWGTFEEMLADAKFAHALV